MKHITQFTIIIAVCSVAELLYIIIGLPIPSSVYGLVLMLVLLLTKVVKIQQVEEVSGFFLGIMPILFLPPTVGLIDTISGIKGQIIALIIIATISTLLTIATTGLLAQWLIRMTSNRRD